MNLRLELATILRDARRRGDLRELELVEHIKKCLYTYDRRPKPKKRSTGQIIESNAVLDQDGIYWHLPDRSD